MLIVKYYTINQGFYHEVDKAFSSDSGRIDRELAYLNWATGMIPAMIPDRFLSRLILVTRKRTVREKSNFCG
jgi:hypothetical protein